MTDHAIMQLQAEFARVACRQCTESGLLALRESADWAARLGGSWESRAAAYAEFHCLLADVTGGSAYYLLARLMSGSVCELITRAGPEAGEFITAAHRRLIRKLEERDADGAAEEMECFVTLVSVLAGTRPRGCAAPSTPLCGAGPRASRPAPGR